MAAGGNGPVVVKLGGSFAFSSRLRNWLDALAACAGRVIIVPGGGPFADAVRAAQPRMGFDDSAAHHMAVLAMEQYGRALASLNKALSPAGSADAIHRDLANGRVPVWMPSQMVLRATDIAQSWEVTSDSLAAWLVGRIGADRLLLVKHVEIRSGQSRSEDLAVMGIVDEALARHLRRSAVSAFVFGPDDHDAAIGAIRDGKTAGISVE
jgi:5-(aminomethyl)-3-furanmethanol phosphate kinase